MKILTGSRQLAVTSLAILVVLLTPLSWVLADTLPATEEWSRTFGGPGLDVGWFVQETSDGGHIIIGHTYSFGAGESDVYLVKTDSQGKEEWYRTFGGSENDYGESVQATSDGGYIIAGYTESYGAGFWDFYLVKTDSQGREEWSTTFGGTDSEMGYSVQETRDGGYVITGYTDSFGAGGYDVYLVKTDPQGKEEWSTTFGGSTDDYGGFVQETRDGEYVITGYTDSFGAGGYDVYLVKVGSQGREVESFSASIVDVEAPSEVFTGESFTMEITILYGFTIPTEIGPVVYDVEAETWILGDPDTLVGEGTKTYSFELTAPEEETTWALEVSVGYYSEGDWIHDEDGYAELFEVSVLIAKADDNSGRGIPGFPVSAIVLGISLAFLLIFYTRRGPSSSLFT